MEEIFPAAILEGKAEPKSTAHTKQEWFSDNLKNPAAVQAQATDMSFFIHRQAESGIRSGWKNFNQTISKEDQEITSVGYMPTVQAPAHELDTLNTGKLMELKWTKQEYERCLVVRLGGLHTSLNFLKAIGQHM